MSADLLAAFGNPSQSESDEGASVPAGTSAAETFPPATTKDESQDHVKDSHNDHRSDPFNFSVLDQINTSSNPNLGGLLSAQYSAQPHQRDRVPPTLFHHDSDSNTDVLFDALDPSNEDFEDDADEFGDFETVQTGPENTGSSRGNRDMERSSHQARPPQSGMDTLKPSSDPKQSSPSLRSGVYGQQSLNLLNLDQEPQAPPDLPDDQNLPLNTRADHVFDDWGDFTDAVPSTSEPLPFPSVREIPQSAANTILVHNTTVRADPGRRLPPGIGIGHVAVPKASTDKPASTQIEHPEKPEEKADEEEEAWEDFVDGPPASSISKKVISSSNIQVPSATDRPERPTNIPPPSILLQLFPEIISQIRATLQSKAGTDIVPLSESIVNVHDTLAHIIAGRQLRWKRDVLLYQSTKISNITSSGPKGMKLASIDRTESMKEDREATDTLSIWSKNGHIFNSLVTRSGGRLTPLGESLRARTSSGVPTAKEACALCGLKREERVHDVDNTVEDSFGEWWIDFWGHRGCWMWWERWRGMLKQR